ncbi:MAG: cytochrome c family protein [Proteobacteria bacterium]|nr:cytochrome c family protein [Pseudomonadota bacterium]
MVNFNTAAGCFLASALFAMVVGKVSNALVDPHHLEKPAIAVSDAEPEAAGPAKPAELPPIAPMLAKANVDHGKQLYQKLCTTCHTDEKGGPNKIGPNLWGVVGRKKGSHPGFSYSSGVEAKGGEWTYEDLNHWLLKPSAFIKGTKMAFAGLPKEQERADLIGYLRTMNDNPPPLPDATEAPAAAPENKPQGQPEKK